MFIYKSEKDKDIILKEFLDDDPDFEKYAGWLRDYDTVKYIGRREYLLTTDVQFIRDYIKSMNESPNDSFFKVFYQDDFVGTFKLGHINWESGVGDAGIMIGEPNARGKGISPRIIRTGVDYGFRILGLRKIVGGCVGGNIPMQKCFEAVGFKKEGCFRSQVYIEGEFQDHVFYGLFRDEFK